MSASQAAVAQYTSGFAAVARAGDSDWLTRLRQRGLAAFEAAGFPSTRDEDWKYTSLRLLERRRFHPAPSPADDAHQPAFETLGLVGLEGPRLVFVNGRYQPALSSTSDVAGLRIEPLGAAVLRNPRWLSEQLGARATLGRHRFAALNTALMQDGAVIELAPRAAPPQPLYLLFLSVPESEPVMAHPRVLLHAGRESTLHLVEHYAGVADTQNLSNAVTELTLDDGAQLEHYRVQLESRSGFQIASLHARLGRDARFVNHNIGLGARLARCDIDVELAAAGSEAVLNGLFIVDERQHIDNHTRIEHLAPNTRSVEEYRGIAAGSGRGVFNGKVIVHPGAQKTDARQSSRNLLLSEHAEIDTKPELEIYADDVKCAHGATVGQLDRDALFYLRTRGLDEEFARGLLTFAFAEDIVRRIALAPLRARLEEALLGRLPASDSIMEFL